LHTRPRAHRAPGIPCALNSERAGNKEYLAQKPCGEIAKLWLQRQPFTNRTNRLHFRPNQRFRG
jgi:hypothetical protein